MKTYKAPRRRSKRSRTRRLLDQMDASNHREWAAVSALLAPLAPTLYTRSRAVEPHRIADATRTASR